MNHNNMGPPEDLFHAIINYPLPFANAYAQKDTRLTYMKNKSLSILSYNLKVAHPNQHIVQLETIINLLC